MVVLIGYDENGDSVFFEGKVCSMCFVVLLLGYFDQFGLQLMVFLLVDDGYGVLWLQMQLVMLLLDGSVFKLLGKLQLLFDYIKSGCFQYCGVDV